MAARSLAAQRVRRLIRRKHRILYDRVCGCCEPERELRHSPSDERPQPTLIDPQSIAIRLVAAAVLGGAVGMERERVESAAGLRTHALVSTGAALLMIVSMFGF